MPAKKKTTAKKKPTPKKTSFRVTKTSPKLERMGTVKPNDPKFGDYEYELREMWFNTSGSVIANAGCADVFVCEKHEIPELIAFLQECLPGK